jgi:hypothetical protein
MRLPGSYDSLDLTAAVAKKLNVNPLLWSLFTISPADALQHLGLGAAGKVFEVRRATTLEDRVQAEALLQALRTGATQLRAEQAVVIGNEDEGSVSALELHVAAAASMTVTAQPTPPPDVTLIVAKPTLQFALRSYTQHQFVGKTFSLAPQPWLDVDATGTAISVDLADGAAHITAAFDCVFAASAQIAGRRRALLTRRSPVQIEASARFTVNPQGQLCLGVGPGIVRVPGLPLPVSLVNTLYQRLHEMLPAVPIVYLPTRFDIAPMANGIRDEMQIQLSDITVTAEALSLAFQLYLSPASGAVVPS